MTVVTAYSELLTVTTAYLQVQLEVPENYQLCTVFPAEFYLERLCTEGLYEV
jgi:hypothetical protein